MQTEQGSRRAITIGRGVAVDDCVVSPVKTCGVAEWGTMAASCGREPISGSGVLLGGELASGDITILGFSYTHAHTKWYF